MYPKLIIKKANLIFKAGTLELSKTSKIDKLNLFYKKKEEFKDDEGYGIYCLLFKDNLIYIGSHTDDKSVINRWYKHLITLTSRFQDVCFLRQKGMDSFDEYEIKKILINNIDVKKNKENKITLDTAINLKKNNKVSISEYKQLVNSRFDKIKKIIKKNYFNEFTENTSIYEDIISPLCEIDFNDDKKIQKILTGGGKAHSRNRFKFSTFYWEIFKKRTEINIFNDFDCVYFKLGDINISRPNKKEFRKKIEKECIKKFRPFANDENFKIYNQKIPSKVNLNEILLFLNKKINDRSI